MTRPLVPVLLAALLASCLLTEPPGDAPQPVSRRPHILHDEVQPPLSAPITSIDPQTTLDIPVDSDPSINLNWALFVDFDPQTLSTYEGVLIPDATMKVPRHVIVPLSGYVDPSACHQIEVVVANDFETKAPFRPKPPGGDVAIWSFRPNGFAGACPGVDAGTFADVSAPDAGSD